MQLDSYADTGAVVSVELVNELAIGYAGGRPATAHEPLPAIAQVLAVDPRSLAQLGEADVPGFIALARRMREVFSDVHAADLDAAAARLNQLLAEHPAAPHLSKGDGRWRLHHHPVDLPVVPMWTSICAEAVARLIGDGHHDRLGTCEAADCDRVYLDLSRNASRRFCSTACQNRVKAAAFRRRRGES
ncbi:MAG: CGNR zinc finger domain-containing protein [Micromonosporaceae bacterium]